MTSVRTKIAALTVGASLALGAGITLSQPADAQGDRMEQHDERLQAKVDDGVITQERADEIRARIAERAERVQARQDDRAERIDDIAAIVGTTGDELVADLRAGISLADLAVDAGVDIDELIDQIQELRTAQIEQAVADGRIDQARADERLDGLREQITARVNGERPEGRRGHHHRRGRGN